MSNARKTIPRTQPAQVHIFSARSQPLTRYVDRNLGTPIVFRNSPRRQAYCHDCGARRWAKNLRIQVYYDMSRVFCAGPHKRKEARRAA